MEIGERAEVDMYYVIPRITPEIILTLVAVGCVSIVSSLHLFNYMM